ncbi:MAG: DinB family protein [Saprospiraceae bacterium]|nr:DinB family protein [Saprospiraceae bacterium]
MEEPISKEKEQLISLFSKLYDGYPWLAVNFEDTIMGLDYQKAFAHPLASCNSIWELVRHLIEWKKNVMLRLKDQVIKTPEHNYIMIVENPNEESWQSTLAEWRALNGEWLDFLKHYDFGKLGAVYPNNKMTYFEHIHGVLQHEAYHLGQMVLLAKLAKNSD